MPARAAVVEDDEMGQVLQFQGDQRDAVSKFLTQNGARAAPGGAAAAAARSDARASVRCMRVPVAEIVDPANVKKHGAG